MLRESLQHTWSLSYSHFRITASPWIFKCCTFKRRCWPKYLKVSEFSRPRVKPKASSFEKSRKSWRRRRRKKFPELKTKKKRCYFSSRHPIRSRSVRGPKKLMPLSSLNDPDQNLERWKFQSFESLDICRTCSPYWRSCLFPMYADDDPKYTKRFSRVPNRLHFVQERVLELRVESLGPVALGRSPLE